MDEELKIKKIRKFRPWYFLVLALISTVVCLYALRQNNLHMAQLRNGVYTADKNNGDVNGALRSLQLYVTSHMNTSLSGGPNAPYPPIQLQYTYERLQKASLQKLGYNSFYTQAQDICQKKYPVESSLYIWQSYVSCVQQYLASKHLNIQVTAYTPPPSLYEFDFLSPSWSPDLAGWSMVLAVVFFVAYLVAIIYKKLRSRHGSA